MKKLIRHTPIALLASGLLVAACTQGEPTDTVAEDTAANIVAVEDEASGIVIVEEAVSELASDAEEASDIVVAAATDPASKLDRTVATVKPGAAVSFSHTLQDKVGPGQNGSVDLRVSEGYEAGTLTVETSGTEGLNVFGSQVTQSFSMDAGDTHDWSVSYSADTDGVYYLNVTATADSGDGLVMSRAYAVRIEVGDMALAKPAAKNGELEMSEDGVPEIVMEAEETIE